MEIQRQAESGASLGDMYQTTPPPDRSLTDIPLLVIDAQSQHSDEAVAISTRTDPKDLSAVSGTNASTASKKRGKRYTGFNVFFKNIGASLINFLFVDDREHHKIVLDQSRKWALIRCSVHIPPVLATIVLTALNIRGYFIGSNFQGSDNAQDDSVNKLALQVTSKLMELLIVASLGRIVLDLLSHELLLSKDGIPFGLLGAALEFKDISTLWSPSLIYSGRVAISGARLALFLGVMFVCMIIATFAGPASALLMIPTIHSNWPAGGADIWLLGNESTLWPTKLDIQSTGGPFCSDPSEDTINRGHINYSGCIWYSTPQISQTFQAWHFELFANMTIMDGFQHTIGIHKSGSTYIDTWVTSSNIASGMLSTLLKDRWWKAINFASITTRGLSSYRNYQYRVYESTIMRVETKLPVVRTRCLPSGPVSPSNVTLFKFPVLPEYHVSGDDVFEVFITPTLSPLIQTQWIDPSQTPGVKGHAKELPTSFLFIQMPAVRDNVIPVTFACSVDARWVLGENISPNVVNDAYQSDHTQSGVVKSFAKDLPIGLNMGPINDGTWTRISADLDWLYVLTPLLNEEGTLQSRDSPGWTSYAALLTNAGFADISAFSGSMQKLLPPIESTLASVVAQGLARIGFSENGGHVRQQSERESIIQYPDNTDESLNSLLQDDGKAVIPRAGVDKANLTKMHWQIFITGYAYKAEGSAYILAFTLLLMHVILAVGHLVFALSKRASSDVWKSVGDLVALSHSSQPDPRALRNTSSGIRSSTTFKRKVRIRVADKETCADGQEELQLLFETTAEDGFSTVREGEAYGAVEKSAARSDE